MLLRQTREIDRFLSAPDPDLRATLIHGRDPSLVRERAESLAGKVTARPDDPFDVAFVDEGDLVDGGERLYGELRAISMMGGRRLVRLRLSGGAGGLEAAAATALSGHLAGDFNPETFLLIEAADLRRGSPLLATASSTHCATIVCFQDEPADLATLVRKELARDGLGLTAAGLDRFVASLPSERLLVRQEIERLALFLGPGGGTVAAEADLDAFVGVEPEASLATAAMDAFGGRVVPAFTGLRRAEEAGERGPAAVRAMGFHLARLRRVIAFAGGGASPQQAVKSAGVFWKHEREFLRQMRTWTHCELDRSQADILTADENCKRALAPDGLIAERLALTVASRARRLGL